jgi:hypothetical protein
MPAAIAGKLAGVHASRPADELRHLYICCSEGACPRTVPATLPFLRRRACVMATSSSVKSDFSRLRFAKTDYRSKMECLALEWFMQARDLIAIARKVAVPIDFPR